MSKVEFFSEGVPVVEINKKLYGRFIRNLISMEGKETSAINIIFCSDMYLLEMNRQYLQHDYLTDIITFDYNEGGFVSGDLYISVDRVEENAVEFGCALEVELARVIFHGILHLSGYGDKTPEEEALMREKENFYLKKFGVVNE